LGDLIPPGEKELEGEYMLCVGDKIYIEENLLAF